MKTLNTYINEWKITDKSVKNIRNKYFVYKHKYEHPIKIFDSDWPQFNDYKDKVYDEHGKHVELDEYGKTNESYNQGEYKFEIKDIDNITICREMFCGCYDLKYVPSFDTSKVTDMLQMFFKCKSLEAVPIFNTSKVKTMRNMFYGCGNLIIAPFFNTKNVIDISGMFIECSKIKKSPKYDTTNVTDIGYMFEGCINLIDVPLFTDISHFKRMAQMFKECEKLSEKTKQDWSQIYDFEWNDKI